MAITAASSNLAGPGARAEQDPVRARLLQRIEVEYAEMPGLTLTGRQAARLLGVDADQIDQLLAELIDRGSLMRDTSGAYRRCGCPRCS